MKYSGVASSYMILSKLPFFMGQYEWKSELLDNF
jgi:hypothetical protein